MSHQIDFKITLWADSSDHLLTLERVLNRLAEAAGPDPHVMLLELSRLFQDMSFKLWSLRKTEVHSIDINWDDEDADQEDSDAA